MRHNPKFGETYEVSPAMNNYLASLKNQQFLRYGLSLFTSQFIFGEKHEQIIDDLYKRSIHKIEGSPNTMHKYGASNVINSGELEQLKKILLPYIYEVFDVDPCKKCTLFTDFSVHYGFLRDDKLDEHVDDSDITVNICLKNTKEFTGLKFNQIPDTLFSIKANKPILVNLDKGDVLVHSGKQRHEVIKNYEKETVDYGERVNLILWLKFL